ncbi:TOMM precursor leader peptide-binding protein [Brevibacillus migulae]|uniref:TOMM precursor leader peptide-binding protein n=1 Tax=Brevibacillus migulae TaxID=1644114 RepID=UPI001431E31A|nr:TOMM precursor leader peptide-binding protein [Brevibacillus migulae]
MSTLIFSCADFDFRQLEDESYEIQTAGHLYRVAKNEQIDALFRNILPKLTGTVPADQALSPTDLQILQGVAPQLMKMGILFSLDQAYQGYVEREADRQLYTHLARTKEQPLDSFLRLKQLGVYLAGNLSMSRMLQPLLTANSCKVTIEAELPLPSIAAMDPTSSLVIVSLAHTQKEMLFSLNKYFQDHKMRWVPVLFDPEKITIGPWIWPERSSCLSCMDMHPHDQRTDGPSSLHEDLTRTFFKGWTSCQSNSMHWVAAMISMQVNQAFGSLTKQTPWGRIVELDCQQLTQANKRVWKHPACPVCTDSAKRPQLWVEATR